MTALDSANNKRTERHAEHPRSILAFLETRLETRLEKLLEKRLEKCLEKRLETLLATCLEMRLETLLATRLEKLQKDRPGSRYGLSPRGRPDNDS